MNKSFFPFIVMIALFSAIFISCDKDKGVTLSGTIIGEGSDWDKVSVTYEDPLSWDLEDTWDPVWAATVPISNGKFSLELPTPEARYFQPFTDDMLYSQFKVSDKTAKGVAAYICAQITQETNGGILEGIATLILAEVKQASITVVQYIYADKKVNISGTDETMYGGFGSVEFNLKMKKGWNTVILSIKASSNDELTMTYKTGNVPSGAVWMTGLDMGARSGIDITNTDIEALLGKIYNNVHTWQK